MQRKVRKAKVRKTWTRNPAEQVIPRKKVYKREKVNRKNYEEEKGEDKCLN